ADVGGPRAEGDPGKRAGARSRRARGDRSRRVGRGRLAPPSQRLVGECVMGARPASVPEPPPVTVLIQGGRLVVGGRASSIEGRDRSASAGGIRSTHGAGGSAVDGASYSYAGWERSKSARGASSSDGRERSASAGGRVLDVHPVGQRQQGDRERDRGRHEEGRAHPVFLARFRRAVTRCRPRFLGSARRT